ncbi:MULTISPECIES: hypothetical protein [Acetobacter]|uniref:hypothetical protein n=1 Tax=Acetobacter TaxID=434 RepID=UPI00376FA270
MKNYSGKHLYEVQLKNGRSNPDWFAFHEGVEELGGKAPDFGGINNIALIGTHHDLTTVEVIVARNMKDDSDLTVTEITKESMEQTHHSIYTETIDNYFLPYESYPAIED